MAVEIKGNEMTGSVKELAEKMGVEDTVARTILKFLVVKGIVKVAGERPNPMGRGVPSALFTIPVTPITLTLLK